MNFSSSNNEEVKFESGVNTALPTITVRKVEMAVKQMKDKSTKHQEIIVYQLFFFKYEGGYN